MLADAGADAVTHRRIAAEAKLPLASTTYHFASKEELLTEALRFASAHDVERLHAAAARAQDWAAGAGEAVSPAQIVAVLAHPTELSPAAGRASLLATYSLILEAARRPALRELSRTWTAAYIETVAGLLAAAGSRTPRDDARLLLAACDGLVIDQLAAGDPADPRPELERLAAILLAAAR